MAFISPLDPQDKIAEEDIGAFKSSLANFGSSLLGGIASGFSSIKAQAQANQQGDKDVSVLDRAINPSAPLSNYVENSFNRTNAGKYVNKKIEQGATATESFFQKASDNLSQKRNPEFSIKDENGKNDYSKLLNPKVLLNVFAEGVGSMIPAIAATVATKNPVSGMVVMGAQEKGSAYNDYINSIAERKGIKPEEVAGQDIKDANEFSTYYGIISGLLEKFGILGSLDNIGKKVAMDGLRKYLVRVPLETLKVATQEGSTEGAQQLAQNAIAKFSGIDPKRDLMQGVVENAVVGGVTGAPFGTAVGVTSKKNKEEQSTEANATETQQTALQLPEVSPQEKEGSFKGLKQLMEAPKVSEMVTSATKTPLTLETLSNLSKKDVVNTSLGLQILQLHHPEDANIRSSLQAIEQTGIETPVIYPQLQEQLKLSEGKLDETPKTPAPEVKMQESINTIPKKTTATEADNALIEDAKKYKTEEEFLKGQGDSFFHGTPEKLDVNNISTKDRGFFITKDKNYADIYQNPSASSRGYGKDRSGNNAKTYEFLLNKNARVFDAQNTRDMKMIEGYWKTESMSGEPIFTESGQLDWTDMDGIVEYIKKHKLPFDAIKSGEGGGVDTFGAKINRADAVVVINPKIIKSRDKLSEIYKKAQEEKAVKTKVGDVEVETTKKQAEQSALPTKKEAAPANNDNAQPVDDIPTIRKELEKAFNELLTKKPSRGNLDAYNVVAADLKDDNDILKHIDNNIKYGKKLNKTHQKMINNIVNSVRSKQKSTELETPNFSLADAKTKIDAALSEDKMRKVVEESRRELNPNLRAVSTFKIFEDIIDVRNQEFMIFGDFNPRENVIRTTRMMDERSAKINLRHEERHLGFMYMSDKERKVVVDWYKGLSDEQKYNIYGGGELGKGTYEAYKEYYEKMESPELRMADETANWFLEGLDYKTYGIDKKVETIYEKILRVIRESFKYLFESAYRSEKNMQKIYDKVFSQDDAVFSEAKKDRMGLFEAGTMPGSVFSYNQILTIGGNSLRAQKKTLAENVTTEKGNLSQEMLLRESYKRVMGEEVPEYLVTALRKAETKLDVKLTVEWGKLAYAAGKRRQIDIQTTKEEFQQSAEEYINRFVRKEKRSEFIQKILASKNQQSLDKLMEKVQKFVEKDKLKTAEKKAKEKQAREAIKKKFDDLRELFRERNVKLRIEKEQAIKDLRKKLKDEFKKKNSTRKGIQKFAEKYVIYSLPLSERGRFLSRVKNAESVNALKKVIEQVNNRRHFYELQQLKKSYSRIIERMGSLPIDNQKAIVAIVERIGMTFPKKIMKRLNLKYDFNSPKVKAVLTELGLDAQHYFELAPTGLLMKVHAKLQDLQLEGRKEIKEAKEMRKDALEAIAQDIISGVVNLDKFNSESATKEERSLYEDIKAIDPTKLKSIPKKSQQKFIEMQLGLIGTDRAARMLEKSKNYDGAITRNFIDPVYVKHNEFSHRDHSNKMAWNKFKEMELGFKSGREIFAGEGTLQEKIKKYYEHILTEQKQLKKMGRRVFIAMARDMDGGREAMKTDKIDSLTDEQIDSIVLTEKEKKIAAFLRKFYDQAYPKVNEAYRRNHPNEEVGFVKNYVPLYSLQSFKQDDSIDTVINRLGFKSVKERVGGEHQLTYDAIQDFASYMEHSEYYVSMSGVLSDVRTLLDRSDVKEALGEVGYNFLSTWQKIMVRKGGALAEETGIDRAITFYGKNLSIFTLGLSPATIVQQPTALINGAREIGAYTVQGTKDFVADYAKKKDQQGWVYFMMEESAQMRDRDGSDLILNDKKANKIIDKIQSGSMKPIKDLDIFAAGSVWIGAYQKKMDELGLDIDFENVNQDALKYADRVVRLTQSSASFKDAPQVLYGKNKRWAKPFFAFQTFMLSAYSQMTDDTYVQVKQGNYALAGYQLGMLLGAGMLARVMADGVRSLIFGEDNEEDKGVGVLMYESIVGNLPFYSNFISVLKYDSNPVAVMDAFLKLVYSVMISFSGKEEETRQRHLIKAIAGASGLFFGLPTKQPANMLIEYFGLNE